MTKFLSESIRNDINIISENASTNDAHLRAVVAAARSEKYADRVLSAVSTLEKGIAKQEVRVAELKDFKDFISRALEDMFDKEVRTPYFNNGGYKNVPADIYEAISYSSVALHTLKGFSKKLDKLDKTSPVVQASKKVVAFFMPYSEMVEQAKNMIVKRQPKEKETVDTYRPAPVGKDAANLVFDALTDFTQAAYDGVLAATKARLVNTLEYFLKMQQENIDNGTHDRYNSVKKIFTGKYSGNVDSNSVQLIYRLTETNGNRSGIRTKAADADAFIEKNAKERADFVREQFIIKNMKKLGSIVEAKKGLLSVDGNYNSINLNNLEGDLIFKFEDGSQFTAHNMIVLSTSVLGNNFYRFPLTFHNITFANGTFKKKMSEKEMNEVFPA